MSQAANFSVPLAGPATPTVMATRTDDSLKALLSSHSGNTEPTYKVAGTKWLDTAVATAWVLKIYDGAAWRTMFKLNPTTGAIEHFWGGFVTIASAATTDLGSVLSNQVIITGTTTITSFGTAPAGTFREVVFNSGLTLTHSASLILPTSANIAAASNDIALFVSEGSGVWRCLQYQRASGQALAHPTASLSAPGIVQLASVAEALAGTDAAKAVTAAALAGSKSLAGNGYYKLPGGLIVQWGTIAFSAASSATGSFPTAFPGGFYSMAIVANANVAAYLSSVSLSSYTINLAAASTLTVYWIALGI